MDLMLLVLLFGGAFSGRLALAVAGVGMFFGERGHPSASLGFRSGQQASCVCVLPGER